MMALEADREAPVRECPLCPPWFECAHFGDQMFRLGSYAAWNLHRPTCDLCRTYGKLPDKWWVWCGEPGPTPEVWGDSPCWAGKVWLVSEQTFIFDTEAEARAEFDRRVALMLGREVA